MAKKRANGEGNIRKRKDGRWEGRYTAGYDLTTGKRIIKNVLGKTQAEVKEKLAVAMDDAKDLDVARSDDYTVGSWLTNWYTLYAKPTVRGIHLMLHNALDRAVKERLIQRNPTADCIAPKLEKKEMKFLPAEDMKAYLDEADRRHVLPMFYLELVSGLRKGELVALLWSDLDIENQTISVSKQATRNENGNIVITRPKTETSVRLVSIPQKAVELLQHEHLKHPDNPYMFPSTRTGEMYYPDSIVTLHKRILKSARLSYINFHAPRHTFATAALQNGVDVKTVSSMLGHYDAGFTLRTYTHATRQKQEQAAEKIGNFMDKVM
ncbi:site-specific integrase [Oscillospiraceae bacterium 42-9]